MNIENEHSADFSELVARYNKWRLIYADAGKPAMDEPIWEAGRLHLRNGYPHPDWTAYIIEPKSDGYEVLESSIERRNTPFESSRGFFSRPEEAGKFIIWNLGERLRVECKIDPIEWSWRAEGLDPRVEKVLISDREARYQLREDPNVYFIMYSGGIKPENHLLPLTYDELDAALTDGLPGCN